MLNNKTRSLEQGIAVLSLFDGMSCAMLALLDQGIKVDKYVAYEIDKYAIKTSMHNFPEIEQRGDVFNADFTEFRNFDYLMGGSPCTYWSIAQKNNRETEASGLGWELFSQYVRALREAQPKYFIYENNKSMSNAVRESITNTFGFKPICINSALLSAQNRQRLYWVGKRMPDGTYSKVEIEQPVDRGILLKDILDNGIAWQDKSFAYTTRCQAATITDTLIKHRHTMTAEPVIFNVPHGFNKGGIKYDKSPTLTAQGDWQHNNFISEPVCVAERGRYGDNEVEQHYEERDDGKTSVLTTVQKDNNVAEPVRVGALPRPNGERSASQGFRIYSTEGKSVGLKGNAGGAGGKTGLYAIPVEFKDNEPTKAISCADGKAYQVYKVKRGFITIKGKEYPIKLADGFYIIRKLTVRECVRLQTVPEWYDFSVVSDTQAYKMLGNGWTVAVISYLLSHTLE